jgi:hypothetical protein
MWGRNLQLNLNIKLPRNILPKINQYSQSIIQMTLFIKKTTSEF